MILLVVSGLYLSVRFEPWWLGVGFGLVCILALGQTLRIFIQEAWVVTLRDGDIRAKTYSGRDIRIAWEEVKEIRRFSRIALGGNLEILRLISKEPKRQIVLTSQLPGFDQLVEAMDSHLTWQPRIRTPNRWERFLQM